MSKMSVDSTDFTRKPDIGSNDKKTDSKRQSYFEQNNNNKNI